MADDGGLRTLFRDHLKAGLQWTSVETGGTGKGIPDSEFCGGGAQGWVEFKQTDGWAVTLDPEQISWHTIRGLRGGRSFIAVRRKHNGGVRRGPRADELWVMPGALAKQLKVGGLKWAREHEDMGAILVRCSGGPARWDWTSVRRVLLSSPASLAAAAEVGGARG